MHGRHALIAIVVTLVPALPVIAEPVLPEVDAIMRTYDRSDAPGAAAVVIRDGQIVHLKGYGLADSEADVMADVATSYRLASVSKQFIGMAIAILKERGQLTYDQTLRDFFPDFPAYGARVTVKHLLHHLGGLYDYEGLIPSSQRDQVLDRDVLQLYKTRTSSTRFTPGSQYSYSNGGYVLLGLIVEEASGMGLANFLRDSIFAPLGMASEMYEGEATPIVQRAYGYSSSGSSWRRTDQSVTSATRGDGGIYASVTDLAKWDAALYSGHTPALVSDATLQEVFTPGRLNGGGSSGYGFGWQIGTYQGMRRQSHTGSTIGFRTAIQRFPDQNLTVAVLVNREGATPWNLAEAIVDRLTAAPAD
jgi:CubicO group peptidase (beta-lactamase class C family)